MVVVALTMVVIIEPESSAWARKAQRNGTVNS